MGKGTIIGHTEGGLYDVRVDYDQTQAAAKKAAYGAAITQLEADREQAETDQNTTPAEVAAKQVQRAENQNQIDQLQADIVGYYADLPPLEIALDSLQDQRDDILEDIAFWEAIPGSEAILEGLREDLAAINQSIALKEAEIAAKYQQITDAQKQQGELQNQNFVLDQEINFLAQYYEQKYQRKIDILDLMIKNKQKQIAYLDAACPASENVRAWCADWTETLSGQVGLIEFDRELSGSENNCIIQPGYDGNAAYQKSRDGALGWSAAMTPAQAFYNFAMLPGAQKWSPLYRLGEITAIAEDGTCTVTMDNHYSSVRPDGYANLPIQYGSAFAGVAVRYMECDSAAFAVGDRVVIEIGITGGPGSGRWVGSNMTVIGFESNPKTCCFLNIKWDDTGDITTDSWSEHDYISPMLGGMAQSEYELFLLSGTYGEPYVRYQGYPVASEIEWTSSSDPEIHSEFAVSNGALSLSTSVVAGHVERCISGLHQEYLSHYAEDDPWRTEYKGGLFEWSAIPPFGDCFSVSNRWYTGVYNDNAGDGSKKYWEAQLNYTEAIGPLEKIYFKTVFNLSKIEGSLRPSGIQYGAAQGRYVMLIEAYDSDEIKIGGAGLTIDVGYGGISESMIGADLGIYFEVTDVMGGIKNTNGIKFIATVGYEIDVEGSFEKVVDVAHLELFGDYPGCTGACSLIENYPSAEDRRAAELPMELEGDFLGIEQGFTAELSLDTELLLYSMSICPGLPTDFINGQTISGITLIDSFVWVREE